MVTAPATRIRIGLVAIGLLALVACENSQAGELQPASPPHSSFTDCHATGEGQMRFLALGDSYTIGESVEEAERWPVQLAALLWAEGFDVAAPEIIARTGWTTGELSSAIDQANPQGPYDLVSLLVGVNNQYRGLSTALYRVEFSVLLKRAIAFAGRDPKRVIVLSIPDWGVTPFAADRDRAQVAAEIDRFNHINRDETEMAGAHYVDVTLISRRAADEPHLIAADGLHPSRQMYTEWAALVFPIACDVLRVSE